MVTLVNSLDLILGNVIRKIKKCKYHFNVCSGRLYAMNYMLKTII